MIREPRLTIQSLVRSWKCEQMRSLGAKIVKTYIVYGSRGHFASEVLQQVKKFNMDKGSIKELLYGGIQELMRNRRYYYHSSVGANYSHWTDDGKIALTDYTNLMVYMMFEAEEVS
jgi:hypothetical protein